MYSSFRATDARNKERAVRAAQAALIAEKKRIYNAERRELRIAKERASVLATPVYAFIWPHRVLLCNGVL